MTPKLQFKSILMKHQASKTGPYNYKSVMWPYTAKHVVEKLWLNDFHLKQTTCRGKKTFKKNCSLLRPWNVLLPTGTSSVSEKARIITKENRRPFLKHAIHILTIDFLSPFCALNCLKRFSNSGMDFCHSMFEQNSSSDSQIDPDDLKLWHWVSKKKNASITLVFRVNR